MRPIVKYRVIAVSSNTNSFGLRQMVLLSRNADGWKVCANALHVSAQGQNVSVELDENGQPDWASAGYELPERLPKAPSEVMIEVFGTEVLS